MAKDFLESKYVTVDTNVEIHYIEKGEGEPIIFIPGLTFSGDIFRAQVERFSDKYRVIAIDPRGQGLSTKGTSGNNYVTHGKDLIAFIKALGLEKVILVGWSTGNLDIWSYAEQAGLDNLKAAVTIDMSPLPLHPDPAWWTEGTIEELSEVASRVLITPEGTREFFKEYAEETMIQHDMTQDEISYLLDMSGKTPYWICGELFASAIFSNYYDTALAISEKLPSLMFIAEHWSDVAEPFYNKNFPGTKTFVMGGHLMFFEYPEKWNAVFADFIEKL
ncbi:MAG: alpha/beta hydrolase [Oscillospiraceae bacterium]|nr:alpha/beta hydrolase [Oscillospiraceae bacterium]